MYYLLHIWGDVEPRIYGPYKSATARNRAARRRVKTDTSGGGFYKVAVNWRRKWIDVQPFTGDELGRDT